MADEGTGQSSSEVPSTVIFRVDGEQFELLRQTILSKPETLLCTLLEDPQRKESGSEPIFVQADKQRFRYILDWYKYGRICIPPTISMEEMRRECAFFQLPDNVQISRENLAGHVVPVTDLVASCAEQAKARWRAAVTTCAATYLYQSALNAKTWSGPMSASVDVDVKECIEREHRPLGATYLPDPLQASEIIAATEQLAAQDGLSVTVTKWSPLNTLFKVELGPKKRPAQEESEADGVRESKRLKSGRSRELAEGLHTVVTTVLERQETQRQEAPRQIREERWASHWDPTYCCTYYFNEATGESTWERPEGVEVAPPEARPPRPRPLPPGVQNNWWRVG